MGLIASPSQYAQPTDLQNVGLLGTFLQTVAPGSITAALQTASGIMDSYLAQRFTMPLVTWGQDILQYCTWIAAYVLVQQRGYNPQNPAEKTFEDRYNMAMKWLKDVASGLATPQCIVDSSPNAVAGGSAPPSNPQVVSPGLQAGVVPVTWQTWGRG